MNPSTSIAQLTNWVRRFFVPVQGGVSSAAETPVSPGYPTENSMSALAAFPWVWAAVRAVAYDLAGLPLIAVRTNPDGTKTPVSDPALELLRAPSARCTGRLLRLQIVTDLTLTGNGYLWHPTMVGDLDPIMRLHPGLTKPNMGGLGFVLSYSYQGTRTIPWDEIIHIRDVSWQDNIEAALGESAIRCLHDDLTSSKAAKKNAANTAKRGTPEFLITAKDAMGGFDQTQAEAIASKWESQLRKGRSAMVVGEALEAIPISITARDMEFSEQEERTVGAILAVFGVPPVRVGLPSANYGTSKQQMRTYWEGLRARASLIDDGLSTLAAPGVRIEHDFSAVEALQVSYSERLERVKTWVDLGASPRDAAKYELFIDAPVGDEPRAATQRPAPESEPDEGQERATGPVRSALRRFLAESGAKYAQRLRSPVEASEWAAWYQADKEALYFLLAGYLETPEQTEKWAGEIAATSCETARQIAARGGDAVIGVERAFCFTETRARHLANRMVG